MAIRGRGLGAFALPQDSFVPFLTIDLKKNFLLVFSWKIEK